MLNPFIRYIKVKIKMKLLMPYSLSPLSLKKKKILVISYSKRRTNTRVRHKYDSKHSKSLYLGLPPARPVITPTCHILIELGYTYNFSTIAKTFLALNKNTCHNGTSKYSKVALITAARDYLIVISRGTYLSWRGHTWGSLRVMHGPSSGT